MVRIHLEVCYPLSALGQTEFLLKNYQSAENYLKALKIRHIVI